MSWAVAYAPGIRREAMELWVVSPDPPATHAAIGEAETRLAADPYAAGRHVAEGLWALAVPTLSVHYRIDPGRREVEITDILPAPRTTR